MIVVILVIVCVVIGVAFFFNSGSSKTKSVGQRIVDSVAPPVPDPPDRSFINLNLSDKPRGQDEEVAGAVPMGILRHLEYIRDVEDAGSRKATGEHSALNITIDFLDDDDDDDDREKDTDEETKAVASSIDIRQRFDKLVATASEFGVAPLSYAECRSFLVALNVINSLSEGEDWNYGLADFAPESPEDDIVRFKWNKLDMQFSNGQFQVLDIRTFDKAYDTLRLGLFGGIDLQIVYLTFYMQDVPKHMRDSVDTASLFLTRYSSVLLQSFPFIADIAGSDQLVQSYGALLLTLHAMKIAENTECNLEEGTVLKSCMETLCAIYRSNKDKGVFKKCLVAVVRLFDDTCFASSLLSKKPTNKLFLSTQFPLEKHVREHLGYFDYVFGVLNADFDFDDVEPEFTYALLNDHIVYRKGDRTEWYMKIPNKLFGKADTPEKREIQLDDSHVTKPIDLRSALVHYLGALREVLSPDPDPASDPEPDPASDADPDPVADVPVASDPFRRMNEMSLYQLMDFVVANNANFVKYSDNRLFKQHLKKNASYGTHFDNFTGFRLPVSHRFEANMLTRLEFEMHEMDRTVDMDKWMQFNNMQDFVAYDLFRIVRMSTDKTPNSIFGQFVTAKPVIELHVPNGKAMYAKRFKSLEDQIKQLTEGDTKKKYSFEIVNTWYEHLKELYEKSSEIPTLETIMATGQIVKNATVDAESYRNDIEEPIKAITKILETTPKSANADVSEVDADYAKKLEPHLKSIDEFVEGARKALVSADASLANMEVLVEKINSDSNINEKQRAQAADAVGAAKNDAAEAKVHKETAEAEAENANAAVTKAEADKAKKRSERDSEDTAKAEAAAEAAAEAEKAKQNAAAAEREADAAAAAAAAAEEREAEDKAVAATVASALEKAVEIENNAVKLVQGAAAEAAEAAEAADKKKVEAEEAAVEAEEAKNSTIKLAEASKAGSLEENKKEGRMANDVEESAASVYASATTSLEAATESAEQAAIARSSSNSSIEGLGIVPNNIEAKGAVDNAKEAEERAGEAEKAAEKAAKEAEEAAKEAAEAADDAEKAEAEKTVDEVVDKVEEEEETVDEVVEEVVDKEEEETVDEVVDKVEEEAADDAEDPEVSSQASFPLANDGSERDYDIFKRPMFGRPSPPMGSIGVFIT